MKEVFNAHITQKQNKKIKQKYYLTKDGWLLGKFAKLLPDYHIKSYSKAINNLSNLNSEKIFTLFHFLIRQICLNTCIQVV